MAIDKKMYIPTFYEGLVKDISVDGKGNFCRRKIHSIFYPQSVTMWLSNEKNGDWYDIYYHGKLMRDYGLLCATTETYALLIAKSVKSGEEIVLFDGAWDIGYDYVFWQLHDEKLLSITKNRKLKKLDTQTVKVRIIAECSVDYEGEKKALGFNDDNQILSDHGRLISWDEANKNGITWLTISLVDRKEKKWHIIDYELS